MARAVGSKWRCRYAAVASSGAPSASSRHCSRLRRQYSRSAPESTNLSQLWQSRFQGQAPPSTTGWKVQKPPSAGVLRRDRSTARAWASAWLSGAAVPARNSPGLAVPGPETQTCCRTFSRSEWERCNGTVGYWNCPNAPPGRQSPATQPLLFLDALEQSPLATSPFQRTDPASEGRALEACLVRRPLPGGANRYSDPAMTC